MSEVFKQGYTLVVGVGADLPDTVNDAKGIADIFKDPARCAYPNDQVQMLTSEQANRETILAVMDLLAKKASSDSVVVIYFSGHGYRVSSPMGDFYYLMPYGYDVNQLKNTAISGSEFTQKLQAIPAQKMLVLLDCCHAGGIGDVKLPPGFEFSKSPLPPEAQTLFIHGSGKVVITSSKDDEFSYAGKPYSAFTLALLEVFSGIGVANKDGYVRVADLALHSREVVPGRTKNRQHPILNFEHADNFVLAYYAAGDTQPKGLPFQEEPEIEPEPGAWQVAIDQRGQTVQGPQTNIGGNVQGPVFSGNFRGPVQAGDTNVGDITGSTGVAIGHGARASVSLNTGVSGDDVAKVFTRLLTIVDKMPDGDEKSDAHNAVQRLEDEAKKGDKADEGRVRKWLKFLAETAPDAWEVAVDTFLNPIKGLSTAFRKIAERAKLERD